MGMCYDVSFMTDIPELADYFPDLKFDSQAAFDFPALDHIQAPGVNAPHPILYVNREDGQVHCKLMEWGVIEFYAKTIPDFKKRNGMLNIRSERILDDPKSYWHKIRNRRCLIPVTGTYEHRGIQGWKNKVPYLIKPEEQDIFFLPGLYSKAEVADLKTGEVLEKWTFAIITRAANDVMKNIHNSGDNRNRMPLFLPFEMGKEFVDLSLTEARYREILNYEMPSDNLEYYPVWTIRSPKMRPDGKYKNQPFEWPGLPPLGQLNPV